MQPHRKIILTVTALFCRCAAWYPLWLLLLSLGTGGVLPAMGVLLLCALTANICVRTFRLHFRRSTPRANILSGIVILLTAAAAVLSVRQLCGGLIAACITAGVTILCTLRGIESEPEDLFPINAYAAFLTGTVIVTAMLSIAQLPSRSGLTLCAAGLISALYFLLRNQFMLLRFVNRRSSTETDVPKDIRRSNLMLVLGVILLVAAVWLFRAPMLHLMQILQDAARRAAGILLEWLTRLVAWLGGNAPAQSPDSSGTASEMPSAGKSHPLWLLLWIPVFAVAWHVWRTFLSEWFFDIREWCIRLIDRLRRAEDADADRMQTESAEYYDTETVLRPTETVRRRRTRWKKELRRWQKLPDSAEKFYAGYALLLRAPCWEDAELCDSDTVREIRGKWLCRHTPQTALDPVTDAYHVHRYAEQPLPDNALPDLTAALKRIAAQ